MRPAWRSLISPAFGALRTYSLWTSCNHGARVRLPRSRGLTESSHMEPRDDTKSREHLDFIRTVLALERTVLAYVRTALAFAAVGVAVGHFFAGAWLAVATLGTFAGFMFAAGAYRSLGVGRSLRHLKAKPR